MDEKRLISPGIMHEGDEEHEHCGQKSLRRTVSSNKKRLNLKVERSR